MSIEKTSGLAYYIAVPLTFLLHYFIFQQKDVIIFSFGAGSECNSLTLTFDGVDLMGERLAEEVVLSMRIFIFSFMLRLFLCSQSYFVH